MFPKEDGILKNITFPYTSVDNVIHAGVRDSLFSCHRLCPYEEDLKMMYQVSIAGMF